MRVVDYLLTRNDVDPERIAATGQSGEGLQVTSHRLMHASVLKNVVVMARYEMETVRDLDHDFYSKHMEKFILYYSANDQWAPKDHYDYMIQHFPKGKS